jgi:hypothetical protein
MSVLIMLAALTIGGQAAEPAATCEVTGEQRAANRMLSFMDFDQRGVTPQTARKLGERKCYAEAAAASEDYLLFGPDLTRREADVVSWHLAQYLASAGRETEAARVMATTRREPEETPDGFDWNTYLVGSYAFLVRDRAMLDEAVERLNAQGGQRNIMNGRVLRRLQKCFGRSYLEAYEGDACAVE